MGRPKRLGIYAWAVVAVGALWLLASPALAETDQELAKRHYKLGEAMYERSDYKNAVEQFERSYEYSKQPALLYNIARCYESLGQYQKAIDVYTKYLATGPAEREPIEARIKNLRRLAEKNGGDASARERPTSEERPPVDTGTGPRPLRVAGWVLVGTGAALLATGLATGLTARARATDVESAGAEGKDWSQVKDTYDSGGALETASIATWVVGGLAAATGVVLLVVDWRSSRSERRAWLVPGLANGGAALVGGLSF